MNIKMKCTQCGCTDLEEVDFPMEVGFNNDGYENIKTNNPYRPYEQKFVKREPVLCQTQYDGDGGVVSFKLENQYFCKTYICTKCGHFEFFSPDLAELIIEERKENAKIQAEIEKIEKQILKNETEIKDIENKISSITKQLEDLDITIRQSNDLKTKKAELTEKLQLLKETNNSLLKQKETLENK